MSNTSAKKTIHTTISNACHALIDRLCTKFNESRTYLSRIGRLALITAAFTSLPLASTQAQKPDFKPGQYNIVFILADDLGWTDINCRDAFWNPTPGGQYDSTYYATPNMAKLRSQSVRFTNAYAACPLCGPSRACILTGKYPARISLTGHPSLQINALANPESGLLQAFSLQQIPHNETTIAEALKPVPGDLSDPANYTSCFIGKAMDSTAGDTSLFTHGFYTTYTSYPSPQAYWPDAPANAFDYCIGHSFDIGNIPGHYYEAKGPNHQYSRQAFAGMSGCPDPRTLWGDPDPATPNEYVTDSLTTKSLAFLQKMSTQDKPFFLYLSHLAVHAPIQAESHDFDKVKRNCIPNTLHNNPTYAAMIKSVDDSLGELMTQLDTLGLADNTIIVFTSDNGGAEFAPQATDNAPLREGKRWMYEGGIRVPLLIKIPGITDTTPDSYKTCDTPVIGADFLPTFTAMAGIDYTDSQLDGVDITPLICNPEKGTIQRYNNALYWHYPLWYPVDHHRTVQASTVIRQGNYKLIKNYNANYQWPQDFDTNAFQLKHTAPGSYELYDLEADISESTNLYTPDTDTPNGKIAQNMIDSLHHHLRTTNAKMPMPSAVNLDTGHIYTPTFDHHTHAPSNGSSIQNAIDDPATRDGHTIKIAPGVHDESINLNGKNITLTSIDPSNPDIIENTILHANQTQPVITFSGTETNQCKISGLTITGGNLVDTNDAGAGIKGNGTHATLSNCIIRNNTSQNGNGGGIYDLDGPITNCTIKENHAATNGGGLDNCNGPILNCTIVQNTASSGAALTNCGPFVTNCKIAFNSAESSPFEQGTYPLFVTNSIVWANGSNPPANPELISYKNSLIQNSINDNTWNTAIGQDKGNNLDKNPQFKNTCLWTDKTIAPANPNPRASNSQFLFNMAIVQPNTQHRYQIGDIIEYDNDGVPRKIIDIKRTQPNQLTLYFDRPISPETKADKSIYNWGPNATSVIEDYLLKPNSPCLLQSPTQIDPTQ